MPKDKHNTSKPVHYQDNLELTSLIIRVQNMHKDVRTRCNVSNHRINQLIKTRVRLKNTDYEDQSKREKKYRILKTLKYKIIGLSEACVADNQTYNRFGDVILLIIKKILTSPQFSGYTYKDEFCSHAVYNILKYIHNFDHTKISERTNQAVNAFSYVTQIIRNAVIYTINARNSEIQDMQNLLKNSLTDSFLRDNVLIRDKERVIPPEKVTKEIYINQDNLDEALTEIAVKASAPNVKKLIIHLPSNAVLDISQYTELENLKKQHEVIEIGNRF